MFRTFTWEEILKSQFSVFSYYLTHLPEDLKKKKNLDIKTSITRYRSAYCIHFSVLLKAMYKVMTFKVCL